MPAEVRDEVHITKSTEPLWLENYKLCEPEQVVRKMEQSADYWEVYQWHLQKFLKLHGVLRDLLLDEKIPSQKLWDAYREAKENLMTAQEIINSDYEKYAK